VDGQPLFVWLGAAELLVRLDAMRLLATEEGRTQAMQSAPVEARRGRRRFVYDRIVFRSGLTWAAYQVRRDLPRRARLRHQLSGLAPAFARSHALKMFPLLKQWID